MDIVKLGRYDIIRVLGKGAMGVVYEARDPNLERRVAIKTIRTQVLSPEAVAEYDSRFRTEARSAARLHHPNIVSVFDSGQDGDTSYLVMEFIQGEDLKHHLECGARFSVRSSVVMVHELLMALDHAHRQNVVHRDIKPANMLIELSGRVKLTDFGVARIQEPDETHLTQIGSAVGTPKYMSPEQAKGQRGDSRSDVFSAGVVLYELLTGTLPFNGDNQFVVIHQIVSHDPTPPSAINPQVNAAMDEVIARAMAKNPDERYATAREFALALRAVAQQMTATSGAATADVAAELGRFQADRTVASPSATLRDGSSTGIFGPVGDVALITTVNHEAELGAWNSVKDRTDAREFLGFLQRFPAGIYARRAQQRVYQLGAGSSLSDAQQQTEPQHRPVAAPALSESSVGHFAPTRPMDSSSQTDLAVQSVGITSTESYPAALAAGRKLTMAVTLGIAASFFVVLAVWIKSANAPDTDALSEKPAPTVVALPASAVASPRALAPASAPLPAGSGTTAKAVVPVPVAAPASVAVAAPPSVSVAAPASVAVAKPLAGASGSASRPVKPRVSAQAPAAVPASAHVPPPAAGDSGSQTTAPPMAQREVPTPGPARANGVGPSAPGEVCSEKSFFLRIACVAAQCNTERYQKTAECVRFREMERMREDQRNNKRVS